MLIQLIESGFNPELSARISTAFILHHSSSVCNVLCAILSSKLSEHLDKLDQFQTSLSKVEEWSNRARDVIETLHKPVEPDIEQIKVSKRKSMVSCFWT